MNKCFSSSPGDSNLFFFCCWEKLIHIKDPAFYKTYEQSLFESSTEKSHPHSNFFILFFEMASGTPVTCRLTQGAVDAIHEFGQGTYDHVVLKCVTAKETIEVESAEKSKVPLEEIAEDLPDTSPRYVLLRFSTEDDPAHTSHYHVFLHFNPMDTLPSIKRSYELSKDSVQGALTALGNLKTVMFTDVHDITPVNMAVAIQGLKGAASSRLDAQFTTYGREKV